MSLLLLLLACGEPVQDFDGDGFDVTVDCDDERATAFPGADELCNGRDDDCDHVVDELFDRDGDGYLTAAEPACAALTALLDCDDGDRDVHPGAEERCDGRDDDCNGLPDDLPDVDQDGFDACHDCDDGNAAIRPGAPELCNGRDDDCSGASDEPFDGDGDGFGACVDCDDADPTRNPGAEEVCNGRDDDCDLLLDEGFDVDEDGWTVCRGDCDDNVPVVNPWAEEVCDKLDNDCSGEIDDAPDRDGDGWHACSIPPDCDDDDPDVYPGAPELCDGVDDDCDGIVPADEADEDEDGVRICAGDCADDDPLRAAGFPELCDGTDNDCDPSVTEDDDADGDGLSACDGDCDPETDEVEACGTCVPVVTDAGGYLFCTDALPWADAAEACLELGTTLAVIDDAVENDLVATTTDLYGGGTWWIGLDDRVTEGQWLWADGSAYAFTAWGTGEPNNSGNEDCVETGFGNGLQWNDQHCENARRYVCELQ